MSNTETITIDGRPVQTLRDILPDPPGLQMLIVGKVPAPVSVASGHYFQGRQGKMFWSRLAASGLLRRSAAFEDDDLLANSMGMTDIVKAPRAYGNEPTPEEYRAGTSRIIALVQRHHPRVVLFVYKGVLDHLAHHQFGITARCVYGFNPAVEPHLGAQAFAFPMPGTPCTSAQAEAAMHALVQVMLERAR